MQLLLLCIYERKKINATQTEAIYRLFFGKKKIRRKNYTNTSYTTMKGMKDRNKSKAKFIFTENLSHTILEVQEKE